MGCDLLQGGPLPVISRVITPLVDNTSYPFIRQFIGGITLVITIVWAHLECINTVILHPCWVDVCSPSKTELSLPKRDTSVVVTLVATLPFRFTRSVG